MTKTDLVTFKNSSKINFILFIMLNHHTKFLFKNSSVSFWLKKYYSV